MMDLATGMAAKRSGPPPPPIDQALRNTLAKNLRAARLAAGLTQKQLADLTGVSREYIGQIENAAANASLDVVSLLASNVGKPALFLLTPTRRS